MVSFYQQNKQNEFHDDQTNNYDDKDHDMGSEEMQPTPQEKKNEYL